MTLINLPQPYPLAWPEDWTRTAASRRTRSPYKQTFTAARAEAERHLRALATAGRFAVTTNIPPRMSGEPDDPGVAVWWLARDEQRVLACDKWSSVRENMRAIAVTLEALRSIDRAGASQILDRAMRAFAPRALPADAGTDGRPWWAAELDIKNWPPSRDVVDAAYKRGARERHPDHGGSTEAFVRLGRAHVEALRWCDAGGVDHG